MRDPVPDRLWKTMRNNNFIFIEMYLFSWLFNKNRIKFSEEEENKSALPSENK